MCYCFVRMRSCSIVIVFRCGYRGEWCLRRLQKEADVSRSGVE